MRRVWSELNTDEERIQFLKNGEAVDTGIIAPVMVDTIIELLQFRSDRASEVGVQPEVIKLLREFFENRRLIRTTKKERVVYRSGHNCLNWIREEGDCIDGHAKEYCEVCKERNKLHKEILRLNYRNNGILTSLRSKVL